MGFARVLLALAVFFYHTGWIGNVALLSPWKAIYAFFIISGFYMSFVLNQKYIGKRNSYLLYITNRLLRIYPLYWLLLILSILLSGVLFLLGKESYGIQSFMNFYSYLYSTNNLLLWLSIVYEVIRHISLIIHSGYFYTDPQVVFFSTLGMTWTLNHEILFYLLAPVLVRSKGILRYIKIFVVVFIAYLFFHYRWLDFRLTSYFFIHSLVYFILGYVSFLLFERFQLHKISVRLASVGTVILWAVIMCYLLLPLPHLQYKWMVIEDWIFYALIVCTLPFAFQFSNRFRWDRKIATLSYPIYMSHLLTNQVLISAGIVEPHTTKAIIYGLLFTFVFSVLIVIFFEHPIERLRQSRFTMRAA